MSLSTHQLYQYLHTISPLSKQDFEALLVVVTPRLLKKGEYFACQGRIEKNCGILTNGVVRTFFRSAQGEEHIKSFGTRFSFVGGFSSLVSGKPNQISVQAMVDCSILTAPYADLVQLYPQRPGLETLARHVVESLFIFKETREIELLSLTAEERYLQFRKQYPQLEAIIPQYHIASYLGVTPTQLSRIRRKLLSQ